MIFGRRKITKRGILKYFDAPIDVFAYDTIPSTNLTAKEMATDGRRDAAVVANAQTMGRGRLGRSFYSPENGIYLSYIYPVSANNVLLITTAVSVAVCRALERVCKKELGIKWVNDIYLDDKKICGILAEGVMNTKGNIDAVVVGVGVNILFDKIPDEIADIADALYKSGEKIPDINLITAEIIKELKNVPKMIKDSDFIGEYREKSIVIGKHVKVISDNCYLADAIDIDQDGGLIVKRCDTGEKITLNTGEISIRFS